MSDRAGRAALALLVLGGCASARVPERPRAMTEADAWLAPMRNYGDDQVWFAEELVPVEEAAAAHLERVGYRVVSPTMLRRLRANVQQGILPGRRAACPAPPPPSSLTQAFLPGASPSELSLRCEGPVCTLRLSVFGAGEGQARGAERRRFEAPAPAAAGPEGWAGLIAAGALREVPVPQGVLGGLGVVGGLTEPRRGLVVRMLFAQRMGPWTTPFITRSLEPHKEALHACTKAEGRWLDWWAQDFVIEVSPEGRVTRCAPNLPDHLPPPAFACRCDVLKRQVHLPPGELGRRARFRIATAIVEGPRSEAAPDPLFRSAHLEARRSEDPSVVLGDNALDRKETQACLRDVDEPFGEHAVPVEFSVGPDGVARRHRAAWPAEIPAATAACLDRALARARFPCPITAPATLDATLAVSLVTTASLRRARDE